MEEKKEKKTIKCSYAVLVIILFAALAFVTDYAFIERKMNKCNCPKCEATNNEVISGDIENKDNTDNTQVTENQTYSYEDIAGVYHAVVNEDNVDFDIFLSLNDDYTFVYDYNVASGNIIYGNYIIDNDKIILNSLFVSGHGAANVSYKNSKFILELSSSNQVIDNTGAKIGLGTGDSINGIILNKDADYQNNIRNFDSLNDSLSNGASYRGEI